MALPIIGTIFQSMRTAELSMKWQRRKENPYLPKGEEEDPLLASLRRDAANVRESNVIASIDGKLKAGAELTDEELNYLRAKNPELYQQAMEIKRERAAYKKQLESCRTKEDVEKLNMQKMQSFLAETKTIRANPGLSRGQKCQQMDRVLRRLMGIKNEHMRFVQSPRFAELPREEELEEEAKAKRKAKHRSDPASPEPPTIPPDDAIWEELQAELAAWGDPAGIMHPLVEPDNRTDSETKPQDTATIPAARIYDASGAVKDDPASRSTLRRKA